MSSVSGGPHDEDGERRADQGEAGHGERAGRLPVVRDEDPRQGGSGVGMRRGGREPPHVLAAVWVPFGMVHGWLVFRLVLSRNGEARAGVDRADFSEVVLR